MFYLDYMCLYKLQHLGTFRCLPLGALGMILSTILVFLCHIYSEWPSLHIMFYLDNIGITHIFSCINICGVPGKLFEHEAMRSSVQTSSEGHGKC